MRSSQVVFVEEQYNISRIFLQLRFPKHNQLWKTLGFGLDGSVVVYTTVTQALQVRFLESQNNISFCCQWFIKRRTAKLQWEWGARSARMCVVMSLKRRVRAARPNPLFINNGICLLLFCYLFYVPETDIMYLTHCC
jgi:hypothetical protein